MALLGISATTSSSSSGLTTDYINTLIRATITAQRQPIYTLTAQKDQLNIKKAVYSDLKNRLSALKSIIDDLTSDDGNTIFDNKAAVSSNSNVITATATSEATNGSYTVSIANLAKAHTVRSDQQADSSEALNLSGTFTLNDVAIEVEIDDSLQDIMNAINSAEYEDDKGVTATIIDDYLVIEADSTGTSNQITYGDTNNILSDLGMLTDVGSFADPLQAAENAEFTVNGIVINRESNTDLDDVINDVTLNLLSETEGTETAEAELEVSPDYAAIRAKISAFVSNLNGTIDYLLAKTRTNVDQEKEIYNRAALTGDTTFTRLRTKLVVAVRSQTAIEPESIGDPTYLADIGITLGDGLKVSLDTDTLNSALESNFEGVTQLFEGVMQHFEYALEPFTTGISSSNTIDLYVESVSTKMDNIDNRIERIEKQLEAKEKMLITQYSYLYMRNIEFTQQQYGMLSIYSNFSIRA